MAAFLGTATAGASPHAGIASAAEVRKALKAFGRPSKSKLVGERTEAVRALGAVMHEKVAKRLLKFVGSEDDPEVLGAAFEALGKHKPFASTVVPKLAGRIAAEAQVERRRMAKGDAGIRTDPRTGDADVHSPAGRVRLLAMRQRGRMLASLLSALTTLGWRIGKSPPDLTPLLQDPFDDLVVAVLRWMGRSKDRSALHAVLDLYRMYPTEASWETGGVVDLGGTDATAKAKWMVRFGHPDKQRARPKVFKALQAMLKEVTGKTFDGPEKLAAHLHQTDAKRRVKTSRGRQ